MKIVTYFKNSRPASYLYLKTAAQIPIPMADVIITTFVKDKLHILKEKDIVRLESQMAKVDAAFALLEHLDPFVSEEQKRSIEILKQRKEAKKKK